MFSGVTRFGIPAMFLMAFAAIVYVLGLAACGAGDSGGAEAFKRGELAKLTVLDAPPVQPEGAFSGPGGETVTLADFRGQVVLVNLWATWCPPCVEEMPTLAALQAARGSEDFRVLAVSVDRVPDADMSREMLDELSEGGLEFFHDPNYQIPFAAQAQGFPTTILYDRQGRELARLSGDADWASEEALGLIDWALGR